MGKEEHKIFTVSKILEVIDIKRIDKNRFRGLHVLNKPDTKSRGVYGGFICAQALLAAFETVEESFKPHSLHSYFTSAGTEDVCFEYEVEELVNGKSFVNRSVRAYQHGQLRYIIMISFTTKNSIEKTRELYVKDPTKPYPFEYQAPPSLRMVQHHPEALPPELSKGAGALEHRFPPDYFDPALSPNENFKSAGERDVGYWLRLMSNNAGFSRRLKYCAAAVMSDSLQLVSFARVLHLPMSDITTGVSGGKGPYYFNVSVDHSVYFHDDDFDPSDFIYLSIQVPRFVNNRGMFQGGMFRKDGKRFASMVQEALIFFHSGSEHKAKL